MLQSELQLTLIRRSASRPHNRWPRPTRPIAGAWIASRTVRKELRLDLADPTCQALDLVRERSRPRQSEVVRECEHPLGELVVLAEQVALPVPKMSELRREPLQVWKLFDRHGCSYRHHRTLT
jgi:hypothetical protein